MSSNPIYGFIKKEDLLDFESIDLTGYDTNKPTLLFADDSDAMVTLFSRLCRRLKLSNYFNILTVSKYDAIFKILKTLSTNSSMKIDYAIIDITFSSYINVNQSSYNLNGIQLVHALYNINKDLKYRFITGHRISRNGNAEYFKDFELYNTKNDLLAYIEYKNKPLSTNKELLHTLFKDTEYEELFI